MKQQVSLPGFAVPSHAPAAPAEAPLHTVVKEILAQAGKRLELTEADIIVSGGRGMGKVTFKESFLPLPPDPHPLPSNLFIRGGQGEAEE